MQYGSNNTLAPYSLRGWTGFKRRSTSQVLRRYYRRRNYFLLGSVAGLRSLFTGGTYRKHKSILTMVSPPNVHGCWGPVDELVLSFLPTTQSTMFQLGLEYQHENHLASVFSKSLTAYDPSVLTIDIEPGDIHAFLRFWKISCSDEANLARLQSDPGQQRSPPYLRLGRVVINLHPDVTDRLQDVDRVRGMAQDWQKLMSTHWRQVQQRLHDPLEFCVNIQSEDGAMATEVVTPDIYTGVRPRMQTRRHSDDSSLTSASSGSSE